MFRLGRFFQGLQMERQAQIAERPTLTIAFLAGCLLLMAAGRPAQAQEGPSSSDSNSSTMNVLPSELTAPTPGANWLSYNGDFSGRRYSSLTQINTDNVGQLRAQWVFHTRSSDRMEVTPVVVNGIMFVTSANDTTALDARTGRVIWRSVRPISEGLIDDASRHISRGVAVWH